MVSPPRTDTFVEHPGGHAVGGGLDEARQFVLSLRDGNDQEALRSAETAKEVLRKRRPTVLAGASAEAKAAAVDITATMGTSDSSWGKIKETMTILGIKGGPRVLLSLVIGCPADD
jgi:hypothetical protein